MRGDTPTRAGRRDIIKILGGGAIMGGGGVALLASVNPVAAQIDAVTKLDGVQRPLDEDGRVSDVLLKGAVEGEYEAPGGNVALAVASADLEYQSADEHPAIASRLGGPMHAETTFDDVDETSGTLQERFELSLVENWGFQPGDFTPDPGQTVSHQFLLVAGFRLYESTAMNAPPIASALNEDRGTVKITRERSEDDDNDGDDDEDDADDDNDARARIRLTKSEFEFEVHEQ